MTNRQLLIRYSFQSLFRSEAMSEAGIDAYRAWLISVAVALVCFHIHFARLLARKYTYIAQTKDHALFRSAVAADELSYLSARFVFVTLIATLQWQSLFPGERDFQVLSPLPIRRADIFLARIIPLAIFVSMFLLAFNLRPALIVPAFARSQSIWAHLIGGLGASLYAFFSVLALQGLCLTILPHRLRSSASFLIQSALLIAAIALIPIVFHIPGLHRLLATRAESLTWMPGVWETLNGSQDPWHRAMFNRAIIASAAAVIGATAAYLNLYRRFADFAAPAKLLVLVQVALGVLLVTAAIVFTARLNEMVNRDPGFERGHVLIFDVRPREIGYQGERLRRFYFELEERLGELAGVGAVGLSRTRHMRGGGYSDRVESPGQATSVNTAIHHGNASFVSALGVPILAGRAITIQEARAGAKVAVIGEDLAKELGIPSPVGTRVRSDGADYLVVGVARKARYSGMERQRQVAYLPIDYGRQSANLLVRTTIPPLAALGPIREIIRKMNKDLPLVDAYTMEEQISRTLQRERLFAWLCGSFGVLALVLCAVGLYGVMSHTTARRTGEIGIRMALGATRGNVMGQVLFEGLRLAFIGLALGVPLALDVARIAASQKLLPEGEMPVWTLVVAIGALAVSAVVAVLAPALRASSIDPMQALRRG